jgi:hypothetical protein
MIATLLASLLLGGILLTAGVAWWFAAGDRGFTRRARQRAPDRSVWDSLANSPPAAVVDDDPESATDRSDPDKAD